MRASAVASAAASAEAFAAVFVAAFAVASVAASAVASVAASASAGFVEAGLDAVADAAFVDADWDAHAAVAVVVDKTAAVAAAIEHVATRADAGEVPVWPWAQVFGVAVAAAADVDAVAADVAAVLHLQECLSMCSLLMTASMAVRLHNLNAS